ncbi:methyl-accepting chemotaxis protein [Chitiniphilus shinanonensis]|uniref:methyl-accepting chemotaxis protein n=1 Tax=Chitiniphilus shinanonensis TaxID=553088 RepID=UPI000363CEE5|nr:methyl-accepting chemotaxis protein [Chitiniphilus shinanonensis]
MRIAAQLKLVSVLTVLALLVLGGWVGWTIHRVAVDFGDNRATQQALAALSDMRSQMLVLSRLDPLAPDARQRVAAAGRLVGERAATARGELGGAFAPLDAALDTHWRNYLKQLDSAVTISADSPADALNIPEQIYRNDLVPTLAALDRVAGAAQQASRGAAAAIDARIAGLAATTLLPLTLAALLIVASQWQLARKLRARLGAMGQAATRLTAGDLTGRMHEHPDEIGALAQALNRFLDRLCATLAQAQEAARTAREDAGHVAGLADDTHHEASRQTGHLQDIAASGAALRESVSAIGERAASAADVAAETLGAVDQARAAGDGTLARLAALASEFDDTAQAMHQLDDAIGRTVEVAGVIAGIAKQTNLLALNAAIEASRAGESGRGFAVVADEVRRLSLSTAEATADIHQIMDTVRERSRRTLAAMRDAGRHVGECHGDGHTVTAALARIGDAAGQVSRMMDAIAGAVEEQGRASEAMSERLVGIGDGAQHSMRRTEAMREEMAGLTVVANRLDEQLAGLRFSA